MNPAAVETNRKTTMNSAPGLSPSNSPEYQDDPMNCKMPNASAIVLLLAIIATVACGCASNNYTQNGVIAGTAIGTTAGAIIGHSRNTAWKVR
jgi:hypothetical protein